MSDDAKESLSKFDAYDIFGYLVPGMFFLVGVYLHAKILKMDAFWKLKDYLPQFVQSKLGDWQGILVFSPIILFAAYMVGHLIASFSAALFDKLLVERAYGYPFQRLLKNFDTILSFNEYQRISMRLYRALFLPLIVLIIYVTYWSIPQWLLKGLLILSLFLLIVKIFLTYALLFDAHDPLDVIPRGYSDPKRKWKSRFAKLGYWLSDLIDKIKIFNLVGELFNLLIGHVLLSVFRMRKPLPYKIQTEFMECFNRIFHIDPRTTQIATDLYWLPYAYLCNSEGKANPKLIQHWLHLYAFARNLAMAFLLLYAYGVILKLTGIVTNKDTWIWSIVTSAGALCFGLRYYYIYYNYYSKYLIRAFIAAAQPPAAGTVPNAL